MRRCFRSLFLAVLAAVLNEVRFCRRSSAESNRRLAIDSDGAGADRYTADDAARTIEIAATLASIYLKRSTIREILERNNNMTVLLRDFPLSQSFIEEGRLEGRQEGMEALLTLVRARHGELGAPLIDALASSQLRLTELTEIVLNASNQIELEHLLEGCDHRA